MSAPTIGGQAVIEGVMMRGPEGYVVAVRRANGDILVDKRLSVPLSKRRRVFGWPVIRGMLTFFETIVIGLRALMFSADIVAQDGQAEAEKEQAEEGTDDRSPDAKKEQKTQGIGTAAMASTLVFALGMGIMLFVVAPNLLLQTVVSEVDYPLRFNLMSGILRMLVFVAYLLVISRINDIQRVFEYHGAEHKTIFAYERGEELNTDSARRHGTVHPRCGTSFVMIVLVVSIILFAPVPVVLKMAVNGFADLHWGWQKLVIIPIHILLLPFIAGLSYEVIRYASRNEKSRIMGIVLAPALLFQRITTKEPDEAQLEVALRALKEVLALRELQCSEIPLGNGDSPC